MLSCCLTRDYLSALRTVRCRARVMRLRSRVVARRINRCNEFRDERRAHARACGLKHGDNHESV